MDKVHVVSLSFGYAEEGYPAELVLHNPEGFNTPYEAIQDLSACLLNEFLDRHKFEMKECCKENQPKFFFCPMCGRNLENIEEFNPIESNGWGNSPFSDWLSSWWSSNCNDMEFSEHIFGYWWPFDGIKRIAAGYDLKESLISIPEKSESFLPLFLDPDKFPDITKSILKLRQSYMDLRGRNPQEAVETWDDVISLFNAGKNL